MFNFTGNDGLISLSMCSSAPRFPKEMMYKNSENNVIPSHFLMFCIFFSIVCRYRMWRLSMLFIQYFQYFSHFA